MNSEKKLHIENTQNQQLSYRFTPAAIASNFVPLIVVLDEDAAFNLKNFEYKMWNILVIVDGFSLQEPLRQLISEIAQEYECEEHIYLYGSSQYDRETLLQAILSKVNAVYTQKPHSNRLNKLTKECEKNGVKVHSNFKVKQGSDKVKTLQEILDFFEKMASL